MKFLNQLILSSFTTLSFSIVATDLVLTSNIDNKNFSSSVKENKIEAFGAKVIQAQQTVDEIKREIEIVDLNLKKDNKNLEEKNNYKVLLETNIKKIEKKIEELTKTINKKITAIAKLKKKNKEIKNKKAKVIVKENEKRKKLVKRFDSLNFQISKLEKRIDSVKGNKEKQKIPLFVKLKNFKEQMEKIQGEIKNVNVETEKRINTKNFLKKQIEKATQDKNWQSNLKNDSKKNMKQSKTKAILVEKQIEKLKQTLSTTQELLKNLKLLNDQAKRDLEKSKESFYSI